MFKKTRARIVDDINARLGTDRILLLDDRANSLGVQSQGRAQIRGNGCLAATAEEIVFVMWFPRKEVHIPRASITAVERTRSHLGKSIGYTLLRVRFTNSDGDPDSIAWFVSDLPRWEALLAS